MFFVHSGKGISVSGDVQSAIETQPNYEKDSERELTPTEKLLLIEIWSLFPDDFAWATKGMALHMKALAQNSVKDLLSSDKKEQTKPRYSLAWELISSLEDNLKTGEGGNDQV